MTLARDHARLHERPPAAALTVPDGRGGKAPNLNRIAADGVWDWARRESAEPPRKTAVSFRAETSASNACSDAMKLGWHPKRGREAPGRSLGRCHDSPPAEGRP
jgi:hypothetical protein